MAEAAETLSSRLTEARKRRGWSLREAERHSGVPNAHISQIEHAGILRPSMAVLSRLAAAYRIPLHDLALLAGHTGPGVYSFTRDRLVDVLARLEAYPATAGPGQRTFIVAESMADAIIEALEEKPEPVHYRWPVVCGGQIPGTRWTGNLDRVTCAACCAITEERLASGKHD